MNRESSHSGSTSCFNCPQCVLKGPGEYCRACPSGWFQPQALHPSAGCKKCPEGFYQNLTGESFCQSLQWKLSGLDCKDTEFLNDTSGFKGYWECVPCSLVDGADCHGDARWTNLKPLFGWYQIPKIELSSPYSTHIFAECLYPPACPGAPNVALKEKYVVYDEIKEVNIDLAMQPAPQGSPHCATHLGFQSNLDFIFVQKWLCVARMVSDAPHLEKSIYDSGVWSWFLSILFFCSAYMSPDTLLQDFRRLQTAHAHSVLKRILLSLLQMLSLFGLFSQVTNLLKNLSVESQLPFRSPLISKYWVSLFWFWQHMLISPSICLSVRVCFLRVLILCIHWTVLAPWCCRTSLAT